MEKRNNRVINEIMSNSSSSIIVLSSSDCENTSFLSELSKRYPTTYWYNAKYDNSFSFSLELASKIIKDEDTFFKMLQLKYCDNDKVDNIIINVILDDIKKRQGDCLCVFDHLENLPDNFDYALIELLIMNCPKNLKLIFISEKLININYNKLEELAPKIIDEFALGINLQSTVVDIDTKDLSNDDIHFLAFISAIEEVPMDFAASIYHLGLAALRYISIKYGTLVINKGNNSFGISRTFHRIITEKSRNIGGSPFTEDLSTLLYHYLDKKGKHINALNWGIQNNRLEFMRNSLIKIGNDYGLIYRMLEMGKCKTCLINEKYVNLDHLSCYAYSIICDYQQGKYKEALRKMEKLMAIEGLPKEVLVKCCYLKVKILTESGEYLKGIEFIRNTIKCDYNLENIQYFECIVSFLPQLLHNVDQNVELESLKNCERYVNNDVNTKSYLYIRMLQAMSEAYFDLGNYRKAIAMVQKIKTIMPFYVVPYRLLQYFYYMNDPVYAEKIALGALVKAKDYYITTDVASIYCLLYKIYSFWGMKNEAIKNIELAINCEDSCDFIKYYAIALRVICYSRFSKKEYAKDIAIIYGKQCEQLGIRHGFLIYGSIAYWYWRNNQRDEALFYSNKCMRGTTAKNGFWLIASGVAINYAMEDESNEDLRQIITKFFYTAEQYAMDMVIIDYDDLFINIIKYAIDHNLNTEYIEKLRNQIKNKIFKTVLGTKVKVEVMSNVSVIINGLEIQWKTKKARELFMIYVIKGTAGIDRSKIFSLLWGEYIYESAINNLKTTNNIIRNALNQAGIDFTLVYKNGKYILKLSNYELDYDKYRKFIDRFNDELVLSEKINLMLDIINLYGTGFAPELNNAEFKEISQEIKQNLCLMLVEFIKLLVEKGRLIDAKKFLNNLSRIDDAGKYQEVIAKFDERKHL